MRKRFILGLMFAAVATAAIAQTTAPPRQQQQPQQPPVQVQIPVQVPPVITQTAPLAGQVPVFIQGYIDGERMRQAMLPYAGRVGGRSMHATRDNPDYDRDGYSAVQFGGPDCDDEDARVNPAQAEVREGEGSTRTATPRRSRTGTLIVMASSRGRR